MALDYDGLVKMVKNSLLLAGKEKTLVDAIADDVTQAGCKAVWLAYVWTFTRKYTTITLTAGDSDGIDLPTDCAAILGLNRLTTDDDGCPIAIHTETIFDEMYPNLAAMSNSTSYDAKLVRDEGVLKAFFGPPSDTAVTIGVPYKMEFKFSTFKNVCPDELTSLLLVAALYHAMPAGTMERPSMYSEYKDQLKMAKKKDRNSEKRAGQLVGGTNRPVTSGIHWILNGAYPYYGH